MKHTWLEAFIAWCIVIVVVLAISWCHDAGAMTPHQEWALWYAGHVGVPYSSTIQAIEWQESSLCEKRIGKHHDYGCGGLQEGAVRAAWGMRVSRYSLIHDDVLNIHITAAYFSYCMDHTRNWMRAVYCYNHGPGPAQKAKWHAILHDSYVRHIQHRMRQVKAYMRKQMSGALTPDDDHAAEILRGIKHGEVVQVNISKPRNVKFLRKYFALMGVAFDNQEMYDNFEDFRSEVIIQAGWFTTHKGLGGDTCKYAKSISFARMDELEFNELYQKTLDTLVSKFLPGTDPQELARAADDILGFA